MNYLKKSAAAALCLCLLLCACGKKYSEIKYTAMDIAVDGNEYINKEVGLRIAFPEGMTVEQDENEIYGVNAYDEAGETGILLFGIAGTDVSAVIADVLADNKGGDEQPTVVDADVPVEIAGRTFRAVHINYGNIDGEKEYNARYFYALQDKIFVITVFSRSETPGTDEIIRFLAEEY